MANTEQSNTVYNENTEIGHVRIASDVLARIAGIAALDVDGVKAVSSSLDRNAVSKAGKNTLSKGVRVLLNDGNAVVDLNVTIGYGYPVPDACRAIQNKVSTTINSMTGLNVTEVNVRVCGVAMEDN